MRIQDAAIALQVSTRTLRHYEANAGPYHGAISGLEHKLEQIDRLIGVLSQKRQAVMERLTSLRAFSVSSFINSKPSPVRLSDVI